MSRHLSLPLRLMANGSLATHDEDSIDDIRQSVEVALRTRRGERLATPELGIGDPTFAGLDVGIALAAVEQWEPRADAELVEQVIESNGLQRTELAVRRREES